MIRVLILVVSLLVVLQPAFAEDPNLKPKQFIYVLRLVPRLHSDSAWTKEDEAVLTQHFDRFKRAIATSELILVGRTQEPGDKTFGIAIFEAKDEAAAKIFMENDPAVMGGLMTAELHPFAVALQRPNPPSRSHK